MLNQSDLYLGASAAWVKAKGEIDPLAASDLPLVLLGPTGCGKSVMAGYIHHQSKRTGGLVEHTLGSVPDALSYSAFLGHNRGAYTGAVERRGVRPMTYRGCGGSWDWCGRGFPVNTISSRPVTTHLVGGNLPAVHPLPEEPIHRLAHVLLHHRLEVPGGGAPPRSVRLSCRACARALPSTHLMSGVWVMARMPAR